MAFAAGTGVSTLVSKIPSKTIVLSGETFRYKIKFTCSGNTAADTCDNVVITDTFASQFSNAPSDVVLDGPATVLASSSFDPASRVVTWTLKSSVEPGTAAELGVSLKFPNGPTPNSTTVTNTVKGRNSAGSLVSVSAAPVTAQAADHMTFIKSIGIPTSTLPLDAPVPFNLLICPTGELGSLNAQNVSFTEYLPTGSTYVTGTASPTPTAITSNTLTWAPGAFSTPDVSATGSCRRVRFRLIFPNGAYNLGDTNVNTATVTYTPVGLTVKTLTASVPLTIGLPVADPEIHKTGAGETSIGSNSLIYYNMSVINKGNTDLLNYVVTDTLPGNFQTEAIVRPALVDPDTEITTTVGATVTFWTKNGTCPSGGAFTFSGYPCVIPAADIGQTFRVYTNNPYPSVNPFASNPLLNLAAGNVITQVVWTWKAIPAGYHYDGASVIGNYKTPGWDGSTFAIGSIITNVYGSQSDNAPSTTVTATTVVVTGTSFPVVNKSVLNGSSVIPLDIVTFRLSLTNSPQAAQSITAPMMADLLPPELDFVSFTSWQNDGTQTSSGVYQISGFGASQVNMVTATAPTVSVVQNYSGTGRTLLRFTWGSGVVVLPQHKFVIDIVTQVKPGTTFGTYHNETAYFPAGVDDTRLCETGADNLDLDADSLITDTVCYNTNRTLSAQFTVNKSAVVESRKFVKGELDSNWHFDPEVGRTIQGGTIDYRFMIKNPGNIPLNNIQLVDVLPFVGDVGEVTQSSRGSQWGTVWDSALTIAPVTGTRTAVTSALTSAPITVTAPYTIYYSNSSKPCTDSVNAPDLFNNTAPKPDGCTAPAWSTTFVSATNKSFRVEFDPALTLYGNQQISFDLRVRAPLYAPGATAGGDNTLGNSDDGNVAWNTFGFASKRSDDGTNLAAQPPRVGVEVENFGIGDYVWFDINHNGVQDSGEPGIPNVAVTLFDPAGTFSRTTTTNGNGYYQFDGLINSENYHAVFTPTLGTNLTLPGGLVITLDNTLQWTPSLSGTISTDSNVTSSVGIVGTTNEVSVTRSYTASLLTGLPYGIRAQYHNPTLDGGIWMPAKLGNYVWKDTNHDGDQDAGEPPISNLQVDLFENGAFSTTTNTDVSGLYTFTQLQPGYVYSVHFALPTPAYSYTWRLNNGSMTNSPTFDTNSNPDWLGDSLTVTLQPGEHNRTVDAGIWGDAGLGDYVWVDLNRNGIQESGESGLGGVLVKLYENGTQTQTYTTDPNGYYGFTHLAPSTSYSVNFTLPNGYSWTLPTQGITTTTDSNVDMNGNTTVVTLGNLEFNPTIDAGVWIPARLGNYVWLDDNADGQQTSGEQGLNGITVTLLYSNGTSYVPYPYGTNMMLTANDPSSKPGYYTFTDLISGTYMVVFTPTKGLTFTFPLQGATATDSNVNNILAGTTSAVVINHGDVNPTIDTGLFTDTVSVGNRVWFDVNDNSSKAGAEVGVDGVRVELYRDSDASGNFSTGDTFVAYSDTVNGGYYTFTELAPSTNNSTTYIVVLSSTNFSTGGPLHGYYSSNYLVNAPDPDNDTNNDDNGTWNSTLGLVAALPISLTLGQEPTNDGDNSKFTNWSVDFGFYKLELGNFVWEDDNNNGKWDNGEQPVPNLPVHLYLGGVEISQTTTSASGYYTFTDLSAGAYTVSVDLPAQWFSSLDVGSSANPDNNIDQDDNGVNSTGAITTGLTIASNIINLSAVTAPIYITNTGTAQNPTLDFGIVRYASLGDFVWEDLNHDGLQDSSEPRIAGVTATLYLAGAVKGVTTTNTSGFYFFGNLTPGVLYTLSFALPTTPFGSVPYTWTVRNNAGATISNATTFSDSNVFEDSTTLPVTLRSNQHNPTIDAGVWRPARLGNYVWLDDNHNGLQDEAASYGMNGVTVTLYYATALNGSYAPYTYGPSQTQTANDPLSNPGYYTFTDLISGFYYVQFELPNGYTWTLQTANTATGSDVDAAGMTAAVQLNAGDVHPHLDAGVWQTAGLGDYVWEDMDRDGVQDIGEPAVPTVTVYLYEEGVLTGTTQTNLSGYYQFVNLFPGKNYTVVFDLPSGYDAFTVQNNAGATISNTTNADDSNADATGTSQVIVLASGQFNPTIDAGVWRYASLGDYVWFDSDKDGQQDASEPPIANVTVRLYQAGSVMLTTTTNASGLYTFSNLLPGVAYSVEFTLPSGMQWTAQTVGITTTDSNVAANGATTSITLSSGEHNSTIDAGLIAPNALGNYVWLDDNHNGVQNEAPSMGINGVTVTLMYFDGSGYLAYPYGISQTVTANDLSGNPGYYTFTNLLPGTYQVQFALPSGYTWTVQTNGTATGSDVDTTGLTGDVVMGATTINPDIDAGVWQTAGLGDYVWADVNRNGTQLGESAIPSVTVRLYENGVLTGTTQTDLNGYYHFVNLFPGAQYTVVFDLPSGYDAFTVQNNTGSTVSNTTNAGDSNADASGTSQVIVLASGEFNPTIDAGVFKYASLGDQVWFDANKDGLQDVTEPFVPSVLVTLYENGAAGPTTTTDSNGFYEFLSLLPGVPYSVEFTLPAGFTWTQMLTAPSTYAGDSNAYWNGATNVITLTSGEHNPTIDAGLIAPNALGNYVWVDDNHDGLQTEPITRGVNGVTVTLMYYSGTGYIAYPYGVNELLTANDINGDAGYYTFTNLFPGTYQVQFDLPSGYAGYQFTQQNNDPVTGSDVNGSGRTADVVMAADTINPDVDAGIWQVASLGDYVWEDLNHDGAQGKSEPAIPGVMVTLYGPAGRGWAVVSSTVTDIDGYYNFANLTPGVSYYVHFDLPTGYHYSNQNNGGDPSQAYGNDSNPDVVTGDTPVIILSSGEHNPTIDAGLWRGAGLGDYVWFDLDRNGTQDPTEPGVGGVTVTLYENGVVSGSVQTGPDGGYTFGGLTPGVPYSVSFELPNGYEFTLPLNEGTSVYSDSDASPVDGSTLPVPLASNEYDPTIDAGVWAQLALGNRVWLDTNNDGQFNNGELGVDGVTVELYRDSDSNGSYTPSMDTLVSTTVTAETGYYTFTNLLPIGYIVVLPQSNFVAGGALYGYHSSTPTAATPNDDVNNNDDGVETGTALVVQYVASRVINLVPGTEPTNDEAPVEDVNASGDWNSNYSVDFGFYKLTLGNVVWEDINNDGLQNNGEPSLSNVSVTLYNAVGTTVISTTQTDANGYYTFVGMLADNYIVGVTPLAGYVSSTGAGQEADPDSNGDANDNGVTTRSNGEIRSVVFTLSAGTNASRPNNIVDNATATTANPTVDFGLWRPAGLGDRVWFDVNHNGVQDAGETGVGNVRVWLVDGNGTRIMTTTTNATGIYTFSNLISGTYSVQFDLNTLPAGRLVTVQDAGSNDTADSDANATTGATQQVVLFPSDVNPTLDMGVWQPAGLGDHVWHDLNGNGQQDAGEPGVPNVTVTLYTLNGPLTTQTNASGYYSFTNLVPGVVYTLNFGLPSGYSYTLQTQGASATDSNVNMAGNSGSITLQPGEFNQTIDAGVVQLAQLGNYVWLDVNQNGKQDVTEQVVTGVTVTLYVGGQPIATTTTDANGIYTFTNLRPGVPYVVGFTAPSGMAWTVPNVTGNDVNSDANGSGLSAPVVLTSGETNLTLDAGLRPGLVLEKIAITSGPNNTVGKDQVITYTIRITNTTSVAMVSVVVTDLLPSGLEFVAGTSTPAQVSENPLKWQFNAVLPGENKVIVFRAKVVPGTTSLLTNVAYVMGGPISGIVASDDASAISDPTAVALASFSAKVEGNGVRIGWSTSLEQDTFGFHLYRSTSENRSEAIRVTRELIVANGRNGGASYEFVDTSAEANKTYSYWLQETELSGVTHEYGPVSTAQAVGGQPSAVTNATLQPVLTELAGGVLVVPQGQTVAQVQQVQIAAGATQEQDPTFASGPSAVKTELVVKADTVNVPAVNAMVAPVPNVGVAAAVIAPALANDVVSAAPANDDVQVAAPAQVEPTESIAQPAPMQTAGVQVMTGASTQKTVLGIVKPSTASAHTQPQTAAKRDMPVNAGLIAGLIGLVALLGVGTGLVIRKRNRSKGSK